MIFVFGNEDDPHIARVRDLIKLKGRECCVVNTWTNSANPEIALIRDTDGYCLWLDGIYFHLFQIEAVWHRLKPSFAEFNYNKDFHIVRFIEREWRHFLESFEHIAFRAKWINPRSAERNTKNKLFQLELARQVGLAVPQSVFGNTSRFKKFLTADHIIYKPFTWFFDPPDRMLYTSPVNEKDFDRKRFLQAPGIFQENLEKSYELRVTIVGDRVFAVKIDSQAITEASQDWRAAISDVKYEEVRLASELQDKLLHFQRLSGLTYGAYDLIVNREGTPVFLEVNPSGQWLWLEEATGMPISETISEEIMRNADK